jgi:uncharacterized phage protein (TIGR01671 family)
MIPKFRAWISTEKRMVETDDLLGIDYENEEIITQEIYFESGLPVERDIDNYDFDDIVLMQSTGLKDKNGKEIFEGDILKVANNDSSWFEVVKYDHDKAMFISKEVNLKYEVPETPLYDLFSPYLFKVEVIGNIWENRDLLGVE